MTGEMPTDPFREIEEDRIRRSIQAVDRAKANQGTTWHSYVAQVIAQTSRSGISEQMESHLDELEEWLPEVARAEGLSDSGRNQEEFEVLKRVVAKNISDTMALARVEMFGQPQEPYKSL